MKEDSQIKKEVNEPVAAEYLLTSGINLIRKNKDQLAKLCQKYQVSNMFVFGSVTNETFSENSDIDILISFRDLSIDQYTDNFFDLHDDLENLFGRKVDLVTEVAISNPFFKEEVQKTRQLIYAD